MLHPWESVFLDFQQQVDDMFDELIYRRWPQARKKEWHPTVDVFETVDSYWVVADVPNVRTEDVQILASPRHLSLNGRRMPMLVEGAVPLQREIRSGDFHRTVVFPHPIVPGESSAVLQMGTLRIKLPRQKGQASEANASTTIEITLQSS